MGLLDDAIRDHLELKRAHGASEEEVRRLEQEALGSPRNAGEFAPSEPAGDMSPDAGYDAPEPAAAAAVAATPDVPTPEPPPEPPPELSPAPEDPPLSEAPPHAEPEPWLEEAAAAPAAPADEDVLEETPEFLQETPEHDRLWFEQKPPRGFEFDE